MNVWEPEGGAPRRGGLGRRWILIVWFSILAISWLGPVILQPWTQYLWFVHDAQRAEIFLTEYKVRGLLLALAFFPAWGLLHWSLTRALRATMVYLRAPQGLMEQKLADLVNFVRDRGADAIRYGAPVVALLFASAFTQQWRAFLFARHAETFGQKDPIFHLDIGFFVFSLPWYQALAAALVFLFGLTLALTLGVYIGMQALASLARIELSRPKVQEHLSLLAGATLLFYGVRMGLSRYDFGLLEGSQFTGAGYADTWRLGAVTLLAGGLILLGALAVALARTGKAYRFLTVGGVGVGLVWLVGVMAIPALIQVLRVTPDRLSYEKPFAERAIAMTRLAYALDRVEEKNTAHTRVPSTGEIQAASSTLENMRLWDPEVLLNSIEVMQSLKQYYKFRDVDLDRYTIDGKQTMVMLSPRDINVAGLQTSAQNWVNMRLRYTHGYGITMSPVNQATRSGQPTFFAKDIPPTGPMAEHLKQPRIYFSDEGPWENPRSNYVLVDTRMDEFDFPSENSDSDSEVYRWTGTRGIPLHNWIVRIVMAASLGDGNMLISRNVTGKTRLLMHRGVRARAQRVFPFFAFDSDPYIVVHEGRLVWILDAYTHTDQVPYSEMSSFNGSKLNYMRNPVKVTVDAYSGEMKAYAIEPDEPILKAVAKIYPGLIEGADAVPESLRAHFRYPEDLFVVQALQLEQYHVTNPTVFLTNEDAWQIAFERVERSKRRMVPYYVQMRLPNEPRDGFVLILPFTPYGKQNMNGWLAAQCDPGSYGKLVLYQYPKGTLVHGPEQMDTIFNQDREIADINRQFTNEQSEIVMGNLLVIPIGNSVLYVEPMFLRSKSAGILAMPELKKVIVAFGDEVVVGDTYAEALERLIGRAPDLALPAPEGEPAEAGPDSPAPPRPAPSTANLTELREALKLLDEADAALRKGDFARYGELQRTAREALRKATGE